MKTKLLMRLTCVVLVVLGGLVWAGRAGAEGESGTAAPAPSGAMSTESVNVDEYIPPSIEGVRDEIRRTQDAIQNLSDIIKRSDDREEQRKERRKAFDAWNASSATIKATLEGVFKRLPKDCKGEAWETLSTTLAQLVQSTRDMGLNSDSWTGIHDAMNSTESCEKKLQAIANRQGEAVQDFDSISSTVKRLTESWGRDRTNLATQRADHSRKVKHLQKLRVEEKMLSDENKLLGEKKAKSTTDWTSKLPVLIVILGVFSLSIMVMVRRFSTAVQREWVESGQVIQFMTVTILIISVLALGLARMIEKEGLGTLLGAIGGYVLAQGVGRAASRKNEQGTAPPPGPPTKPLAPGGS